MAYDSAVVSFTTKTNKVDLVDAAHINTVQTEIVRIETILGVNVKGNQADLKTRLANALDTDGSIFSGSSYPSGLPSQLFYRTDLDLLYVRNAANSAWNQVGQSLSATLFQYMGQHEDQGSNAGEYTGTSLTPSAVTGNYRFLQMTGTTYITKNRTKWTKIAGVSTVTIHAYIWNSDGSTGQANIRVNIGSATGNVSGTVAQTTPEYKTFTIDVSGLSNGTVYDVTIDLKNISGARTFCSQVIALGS